MGFFRKSGIVLLGIFLFLLLLAGGIILTVSFSLEHDNLQDSLRGLLKSAIFAQTAELNETSEMYLNMTNFCVNNTQYFLGNDGLTSAVNVPCTEVAKGPDAVVDFTLNDLIDKFYYKKYDCVSFSACLDKSSNSDGFPTYLISEQFKKYLTTKLYFVLLFVALSLAALFFIFENKKSLLFFAGALFLFGSFVLFGVLKVLSGLINSVSSASGASSASSIGGLFNSGLSHVFWIYFFIGVLLFLVGIVLRIVLYFSEKDQKIKTNSK